MRKDFSDVPDGDKKIKMMILHREKAVKIEKSENHGPFFNLSLHQVLTGDWFCRPAGLTPILDVKKKDIYIKQKVKHDKARASTAYNTDRDKKNKKTKDAKVFDQTREGHQLDSCYSS